MDSEQINFYSDGVKLAGTFTRAVGALTGEKRPLIVCVHGYTGRKGQYMPAYVRELTGAGYHTLDFFHRGFGDSEGIRHRNNPWEQVADIANALVYVRQRPDVDTARIALYGTSFGGSTVMVAAAKDREVVCAVSVGSPADCGRSMRSKRSYSDTVFFEDMLREDRVQRVLTGQSRRVPYNELAPLGRAETDSLSRVYKLVPDSEGYPLENYDLAHTLVPEDHVGNIAPRPTLFIHAERDTTVPLGEAQSFYDHANEPKKLIVLPGASHTDVYEPGNPAVFMQVAEHMKEFFAQHLKQECA